MIKARYDPIISNTLIVPSFFKKKSNGKTLFVKIGGARKSVYNNYFFTWKIFKGLFLSSVL